MTALYLADYGAPDDSAEPPHGDACYCAACVAAEEAPGLHARAAAGDPDAVAAMWEQWEAGA